MEKLVFGVEGFLGFVEVEGFVEVFGFVDFEFVLGSVGGRRIIGVHYMVILFFIKLESCLNFKNR